MRRRLLFLALLILPLLGGCALFRHTEEMPPRHEHVFVEAHLTWPSTVPRPEGSTVDMDIPFIPLLSFADDCLPTFAPVNGMVRGFDPVTEFPILQAPEGTRLLVWVINDSDDPSPYYASIIHAFVYPLDWKIRARDGGLSSHDIGWVALYRNAGGSTPWIDATHDERALLGTDRRFMRPMTEAEKQAAREEAARRARSYTPMPGPFRWSHMHNNLNFGSRHRW